MLVGLRATAGAAAAVARGNFRRVGRTTSCRRIAGRNVSIAGPSLRASRCCRRAAALSRCCREPPRVAVLSKSRRELGPSQYIVTFRLSTEGVQAKKTRSVPVAPRARLRHVLRPGILLDRCRRSRAGGGRPGRGGRRRALARADGAAAAAAADADGAAAWSHAVAAAQGAERRRLGQPHGPARPVGGARARERREGRRRERAARARALRPPSSLSLSRALARPSRCTRATPSTSEPLPRGRDAHPRAALHALVFRTGKMVVTGARSEATGAGGRKFAKILQKVGSRVRFHNSACARARRARARARAPRGRAALLLALSRSAFTPPPPRARARTWSRRATSASGSGRGARVRARQVLELRARALPGGSCTG